MVEWEDVGVEFINGVVGGRGPSTHYPSHPETPSQQVRSRADHNIVYVGKEGGESSEREAGGVESWVGGIARESLFCVRSLCSDTYKSC